MGGGKSSWTEERSVGEWGESTGESRVGIVVTGIMSDRERGKEGR